MTFRRLAPIDTAIQRTGQSRIVVLDDYPDELLSLSGDFERALNAERTLSLLTELSNKTTLLLRAMEREHGVSAAEAKSLIEKCRTLEAENQAMKHSILVSRANSFELAVILVSLAILGFSLSVLLLTPASTLAAFGLATAAAGLLPALLSIRRRS